MSADNELPRLGLIVNPRARAVRKLYWRGERFWEEMLAAARVRVAGNDDELRQALKEFRAQGVNVLGTLGGDGTMSHVYNRLRDFWGEQLPWLLPLPAGTLNAVPKALGLGQKPRLLLERYLQLEKKLPLAELPRRRLRVLSIRDHTLETSILAFSFATGMIFRSLEDYYQNPAPGLRDILRAGVLPLIWVVWPSAASDAYYRPVPAELSLDGRRLEWKSISLLVASTRKDLVLWYSPFPAEATEQEGFLCLANSMRRPKLLRHLPWLLKGSYRGEDHFAGAVRSLELVVDIGYSVDGEIYHRQNGQPCRVSIRQGPELSFVCPA